MTIRVLKYIAPLAALAALAAPALAQQGSDWRNHHPTYPPHTINGRQSNQHNRIAEGVRHDALTRREAERLREREAHIRRQEARYRASGHHLSAAERRRLTAEQNRASRAIYRQKHDNQHR